MPASYESGDRFLRAWTAFGLLAVGVLLALPLAALVSRMAPSELVEAAAAPGALTALWLSLQLGTAALIVVVVVGTPVAWRLATRPGRAAGIATVAIELPLVLPPAVAGIALLAAFGPEGLLGSTFAAVGVHTTATRAAVVVALVFVAGPFYLRYAQSAFASIDRELLDTARTTGRSRLAVFMRIGLPLARPGLLAGGALTWARALGEFGATMMFAGSVPGVTQTLTLAIYGAKDAGNLDLAIALSTVMLGASVVVLVGVRLIESGFARRRREQPRPQGAC